MPDFVPVSNPLDLTAQTLVDPELYRRVLAALIDDSRCRSILFGIIHADATTCALNFPAIIAAIRELAPAKPVLFAGLDEGRSFPRSTSTRCVRSASRTSHRPSVRCARWFSSSLTSPAVVFD